MTLEGESVPGPGAWAQTVKSWSRVIESVGLPVVVVDKRLTIIEANLAAASLARRDAAQLVGSPMADIVGPSTLDAVRVVVGRVLTDGHAESESGPLSFRGAPHRWVMATGTRVALADGSAAAALFVHDVTPERFVRRRERHEAWLRQRATDEMLRALDSERREIARGLQDSVGQILAALKINAGVVASQVEDEEIQSRISASRAMLDQAIAATRSYTYALHPPALQELGVSGALETLVRRHDADLDGSWTFTGDDVSLDHATTVLLYRAATELTRNVIRHAGARHVDITLNVSGDEVVMRVHDDGRGFGASATGEAGAGLLSVSHQVERVGGSLLIASEAGDTTVTVIVPKGARAEGDSGKGSAL